jgi:hypothetical protein
MSESTLTTTGAFVEPFRDGRSATIERDDKETCASKCRVSDGPYELRTAIPNRAYDDVTQTLRDAGLIPNATLMIRPVPA